MGNPSYKGVFQLSSGSTHAPLERGVADLVRSNQAPYEVSIRFGEVNIETTGKLPTSIRVLWRLVYLKYPNWLLYDHIRAIQLPKWSARE